jgi:hypothetical protein
MRLWDPAKWNEQAWCLNLVRNAVFAWTTDYLKSGRRRCAQNRPRRPGRRPGAHLSAHSDNVNYFGAIIVDTNHELAQLDQLDSGPCAVGAEYCVRAAQ